MIELEFLGRSGDARSVILSDAEGERYSVVITDQLRAAVRREPVAKEGTRVADPVSVSLRPSHIQAMLREGISAEEIAAAQGIPLESVTRYESPVQAEKAWAIGRAQQAPITPEAECPTLEDLVINRLAARGVDYHSLTWDALRRPGEDWEISLTFVQSAVEKTATWTLASSGHEVTAVDQEANWLTETASPLAPVSAFFAPSSSPVHTDDSQSHIEALVDRANTERGRRQAVLEDIDGGDSPDSNDFPFFSGRMLQFETEDAGDEGEDTADSSADNNVSSATEDVAPIDLTQRLRRAGAASQEGRKSPAEREEHQHGRGPSAAEERTAAEDSGAARLFEVENPPRTSA